MVNVEKHKVKAIYNNKEDVHMGLGGKGGSGGTGGGEAGKSGFPFIILLFIVLIIVGVSYIGLGF
ncbi:hydrolase [Bacillus toyonensis]|nr:hydrolase [Bacillus toyonensis]